MRTPRTAPSRSAIRRAVTLRAVCPHRIGAGTYYRGVNWLARVGFQHAFPEMTKGLNGHNLFDGGVRKHASFKKDEVLEPGRSIRLYGIIKLN